MCCLSMGEAAGTAAWMSLQKGITPRELDRKELQRELIANGVNLGQMFRTIPGVTDAEEQYADDYANPEFHTDAVTVKDAGNAYTMQGKKTGLN